MKKILALVLSIMLVVSVSAFTVSATEPISPSDSTTGYYCEVALFVKDNVSWVLSNSDSVYVTTDGRYVVEMTDLAIPVDTLCLCYIKDVDAEYNGLTASNLPENTEIITEKIVLNGSRTITPEDNVRTAMKKGVFDICYENDWEPTDCTADFTKVQEINSVRVTFTVKGLGGEYVDMDPQPEEEKPAETPADDTTVDVGVGTEDTVAEEEKGCVGGAVYLPVAAAIIAAALIIFKKRA